MAKIKIYMDNCTYNRPFDDQTQIKITLETVAKQHIQRLVIERSIDLVYSYINRFENDKNPHSANKKSINEFFKKANIYIDGSYSINIEKRAITIKESGLKTVDAFHISCAIESKCDYFITTDKPLLKYICSEIVICNPIQFLDYLEEPKNA